MIDNQKMQFLHKFKYEQEIAFATKMKNDCTQPNIVP